MGESDNVLLSPSPTRSQTLALAGIDLDVQRRGVRLDTDLRGDFTYLDYVQSAFHRQILGRFDGTASWAFVPDRLVWNLQDTYGEAQVDPFAPVTPTNLESVNVVSTGPDLTLRPSESLFLKLGGRYTDVRYETSPFDTGRTSATLGIGEEFSLASTASFNAMLESVHFRQAQSTPDYHRRRFFAHYDLRGSRTQVSLNGGVSQSNSTGSTYTTPFVQVEASRTLTAATRLFLTGGRQLTDASDAFRNLQSGASGGLPIGASTLTAANYVMGYANGGWRFDRQRTSLAVTGHWERDTYDVSHSALNVERSGAELRIGRRLTSVLSGDVYGAWNRENYTQVGASDDYTVIGGSLMFLAGRKLQFSLRVTHDERSGHGLVQHYTENRAFLVADYRLLPP